MNLSPTSFFDLAPLAGSRRPVAAAAVLCCAFVGGCSKRDVKTVEVTGTVRLEKGAWPAEGNISFVPLEAASGYPLRPGWAVFNSNGEFSAGCYEDGDGLIPGKYVVNIDCWDAEAKPGRGKPAPSCIPAKYQRGFKELAVPADGDGPITVQWTIPAK